MMLRSGLLRYVSFFVFCRRNAGTSLVSQQGGFGITPTPLWCDTNED
ncbi:hypothetical protein [Bacteroides sp.]